MEAISKLIAFGFDFKISDSGAIGIKPVWTNLPGKDITKPLFTEIIHDKATAIDYIRRIVEAEFDCSNGMIYDEIGKLLDASQVRCRWLRADIYSESGRLVLTGVKEISD